MRIVKIKENHFKILVLWFLSGIIVLICLTLLYFKKYEDGIFWIAVVSIIYFLLSAEIIKAYLGLRKNEK